MPPRLRRRTAVPPRADLVARASYIVAVRRDLERSSYVPDLEASMDMLAQVVETNFDWIAGLDLPTSVDGVISTNCPEFVDENDRCEDVSTSIGIFLRDETDTHSVVDFEVALEDAIFHQALQASLDEINLHSPAWIVTGMIDPPTPASLSREKSALSEGEAVGIAFASVVLVLAGLFIFLRRNRSCRIEVEKDADDDELKASPDEESLSDPQPVSAPPPQSPLKQTEVGSATEKEATHTAMSDEESKRLKSNLGSSISKYDWSAVGVTAALLASTSSSSVEGISTMNSTRGKRKKEMSELDPKRAAELDRLVEAGDWEAVVQAAVRFESEQSLTRPHTLTSLDSDPLSLGTGSAFGSESEDETDDFLSHDTSDRASSTGSNACSAASTGPSGGSVSGNSTGRLTVVSSASEALSRHRRLREIRLEIRKLVYEVVPEEADHIDKMLRQFEGREEELLESLRTMKERVVAQRARLAGQKYAKRAAQATIAGKTHNGESDEVVLTLDEEFEELAGSVSNTSDPAAAAAAEWAIAQSLSAMVQGDEMSAGNGNDSTSEYGEGESSGSFVST